MIDYIVKFGATSNILDIFIKDSTTTGTTQAGLTGLAFNTGSLTCYYHRNTAAAPVAVSLVTMTVGTFTSSGFKEIDSVNMPGAYQLCIPDAAFVAGATLVKVSMKGAANMVSLDITIRLTSLDLDSATVTLGASQTTNITGNITGNVSGSVGSVTGNVGGNLLGTLTSTERNAIADANLNRDMSAVTVTNSRSPLNALRFLRNKWSVAATTLTITKEDDTTAAWTAVVTQDATALPITGSDPA